MYNFMKNNKEGSMDFDNLDTIRKFHGKKDEKGFILVHVAMNGHTPELVEGTLDLLKSTENRDRENFNDAMIRL